MRIAGHVHRTPVLTSRTIDADVGAETFLKAEHLQRIGAFKIRGATNAVRSLDDTAARRGVTCHSSGNHGQAVALAAREHGIRATVVMPSTAPAVKRAAVEGYGATVVTCGPTVSDREAAVADVVAGTGAEEIHPFDDPRVIAGQGTVALELLRDVTDLDAIVVPVGGGGLASGTCLAATLLAPGARVVLAEPAEGADAEPSFRTGELVGGGQPHTIADGLRTSLSIRTLSIIRAHAENVVTVDEAAVVAAMRLLWERTKQVVEPSGAVALAALRAGLVPGRRVGVVLTGGNVDLDHLPWMTGASS